MKIATRILRSAVGRIVIPEDVPEGATLFYTTTDFDGFLNVDSLLRLRAAIEESSGREASVATCHQVHGAAVAGVGREVANWCETSACDALWTSENNVALGIKVADCLPVTFIDRTSNCVANAHAGWRGTAAGIVEETLKVASYRSEYDSMVAYLGPSIRECCFEVGEEVIDAFSLRYGDVSEFVDRSGAKPHVAIASIVERSLMRSGLSPENVRDTGICTRCDDSIFHSFRRSGINAGRNLAIVVQ